MGSYTSCGCVTTTVWKHYMCANETHGGKTRLEQHKSAMSYCESNTRRNNNLYGHLPSISKTIPLRQTRHVGYCSRCNDRRDFLLWTFRHGQASVGRPVRTYLHFLSVETGWSLENLDRAMDDREGWRERERLREIRKVSGTWMMMLRKSYVPYKRYVKLGTVVGSDPKAPFSIATIPRCRGVRYSFSWIAPLYPWYVPCNAEY